MGKTIIISERQLKEIVGADSMYLDSANSDFNEFNADDEVYVGAKLDNKTDADPLTLDDFASKLAKNPSWTNHGNTRPIPINCSKKKSKITEENSAGENRTWSIPDELYTQLQTNAANYKGDKNASGWDRINNLINQRNVGYDEMRRLKNFFDKKANKEPEHFKLIGGDKMKQWVNNSLKSFRGAVAGDKANRAAMGQSNVYQQAGGTKDSGNGMAHTPKTTTTFDGSVDTF